MACGVTRFGLVCNNSGTTSHAGLHTAPLPTGPGPVKTYSWKSPASGQTAVNSDAAPAFHKPQVVGQLDNA